MTTEEYLKGLQTLNDELDKVGKKVQDQTNKINSDIQITKDRYDSLLKQQAIFNKEPDKVYFQNTLSTTQFFDGSLAKDVFNMNGNAPSWYYKTYARKVRGLDMQGAAAYDVNSNNLNNQSPNASITLNNGGSSNVGFVNSKIQGIMDQKWWAWWVLQLSVIQKFTGLVDFETSDKRLLVQLYKLYQLAILSGSAVIRKKEDKYAIYNAYNVKYNEFLEPISCTISNADWFFNGGDIPKDDDDKKINLKDSDEYILLNWDINNYNIWFYTVFYTIDYIDLIYIWLNRTFISRAIIFQEVGSAGASKEEAIQLMNPLNTVVQIRTSGLEAAENLIKSERTNELEIANKYKYVQLGDSQSDAVFSSFPKIWMNIWDSILGIVPPNNKLDSSRSISDEVEPNQQINKILQKKYGLPLDLFCEALKEKWSVDVSYNLIYEEQEKKDELDNNAAFKQEGGNENEQHSINSAADVK